MCTACKEHRAEEDTVDKAFAEGKEARGRIWSKKLHRYVKHGEVVQCTE